VWFEFDTDSICRVTVDMNHGDDDEHFIIITGMDADGRFDIDREGHMDVSSVYGRDAAMTLDDGTAAARTDEAGSRSLEIISDWLWDRGTMARRQQDNNSAPQSRMPEAEYARPIS
jgi:hypothetical protein